MTPQEIIDNNRILYVFMGHPEYIPITDGLSSALGYHYDWKMLMGVVQAIGDKTEHELVSGYDYSYWNRYGENPILDKEGNPQEFGGYSDIINIYEACTAFVKWYNQNKGGK